jgi:hypothetical protein
MQVCSLVRQVCKANLAGVSVLALKCLIYAVFRRKPA